MTTYARNVNNTAVDVVTTDPTRLFHPEIAAEFITVPDGTINGASYAEGTWTNPPPVEPKAVQVLSPLTPMQFYLAFTPAERIAIKASTDPMVKEFWETFTMAQQTNTPIDPGLLSVQQALGYLAAPVSPGPGAGVLASAERIGQILAGTPQ